MDNVQHAAKLHTSLKTRETLQAFDAALKVIVDKVHGTWDPASKLANPLRCESILFHDITSEWNIGYRYEGNMYKVCAFKSICCIVCIYECVCLVTWMYV